MVWSTIKSSRSKTVDSRPEPAGRTAVFAKSNIAGMLPKSHRFPAGYLWRPTIASNVWQDTIVIAFMAVVMLIISLTAPVAGNFWWSDAPRHALDGLLVHDLLADMRLSDLKQQAVNYYIQYPALTILFYPPLMPLLLAGWFALFGFSHPVAQAAVSAMYGLLAIGTWLLARQWLPRWQAAGVALLLVGAGEVALWGRQVMLDVPAFAWAVLATWCFIRYLDHGRPRDLYAATLLLLCTLYTKQTFVFLLPVLLVALVSVRGRAALHDAQVWTNIAIITVGLIPLAVLTIEFGQANFSSAVGSARPDLPRDSLAAWLFYAEQLPDSLGWPALVLAVIYAIGAAVRRDWRPRGAGLLVLTLWLVASYLMFSAIAVREPRHGMPILLPLAVFAGLALNRLLARIDPRMATVAALVLAVATLGTTLATRPVPAVGGYAEAAATIARMAPPHSVVLFSGERDGSFIFNVRQRDPARVWSVLRADKLLLRVAIERERGVADRDLTAANIGSLLDRYGVRYVVAQSDFWTDLPSMQRLQDLLRSDRFEEVARIPVTANVPTRDRELRIYRNLGPVDADPAPITLEMLSIGQSFSGDFGKARGPDRTTGDNP